MKPNLETIDMECPSSKCNNERREFMYIQEVGVPWAKKPLYMCPYCAYSMVLKPIEKGVSLIT